MHASWKSYGHNCISEIKVSLANWAFHHYYLDKDSDDEVATEQLTARVDEQVDVTFMPHDDPKIS